MSAIDTLLSNFLQPLQGPAIASQKDGVLHRVHCSLNINTETGRLSARRPNLQNQPAGDKDSYKVLAWTWPSMVRWQARCAAWPTAEGNDPLAVSLDC